MKFFKLSSREMSQRVEENYIWSIMNNMKNGNSGLMKGNATSRLVDGIVLVVKVMFY